MSATGSLVKIAVPDIGDFGEVPVIELLVAVGDTVAAEDPLVTLESDKATMDVPSPSAGVVKAIHVKVGDKVTEGSALVDLEGDEQAADPEASAPSPAPGEAESPQAAPAPAPAPTRAAASAPETPAPATPAPAKAANGNGGANGAAVYASPSVRRLARELSVDLHEVSGSGRKGRVVADDVRGAGSGSSAGSSAGVPTNGSAAGLNLAPWPTVDFEKFGPIERVERSRIQKISAPNLARNWVMIPHVTHNDEADITDLEAWRKQLNAENAKSGVKFTMVSFLIAACVATLKEFPTVNSSLDGDDLVLRKYYNIGFAADTPGGLVVPVIKNADTKGLVEIATELTELSGKAREGKIGPGDMSGGTFTISSLGGIGGTSFTPIINAPEVAILGVTRASIKPIWNENAGEFVPRLMVPLSLSYDHRVIDGASAARFVAHLVNILTDLRRALL
jgi:pyruvate dehydrogenase E2 component (dihydrolipoamide acetyltransferase)